MTVAEFYPPATGANVSQGVHFMALFLRLLAHPNRRLQEKILKKIGPGLLDHRIPEAPSPELAPYVSELKDLFDQALAQYPGMLRELTAHLQTGEDLGEAFSPNFG